MNCINLIGQKEARLVPERQVPVEHMKRVKLPETGSDARKTFAEAVLEQRYTGPEEVIPIEVVGGDDLEGVEMLESDGMLFSKFKTKFGESLVWFDLEAGGMYVGGGWGLGIKTQEEVNTTSWMNFLAELYYDYVTGKTVKACKSRKLNRPRPHKGYSVPRSEVQVVYLPRQIRTSPNTESRRVYDGPERPVGAHDVKHHFRKLKKGKNATEAHLQEIREKYDKPRGTRVEKNLRKRPGWTFVLPHKRGVGANADDEKYKKLPKFVKEVFSQEIEEEIASLEPVELEAQKV